LVFATADTVNAPQQRELNAPMPTIYPLGFAIGVAVVLVGLVIDPLVISSIGIVIATVFGALWARDATIELRHRAERVEPEAGKLITADAGRIATVPRATTDGKDRYPRGHFLGRATLGLGALIGGLITVPVVGFAVLPSFLGQKKHEVDLGLVSDFPEGEWFITTFLTDPNDDEVSGHTAFVRNNGTINNIPSFTIISNRCVHLGCPTQANGPTGSFLGKKTVVEHTANGTVALVPVVPAGYGCPCHGSQFDTEGNRTAGPAVRALDRYSFYIKNGHVVLLSTYSVSHVTGTGAEAKIYKYKLAGPGEPVDGPEQWLYPLQAPHH
jgi:Rieske Fe-S protein